MAKRHHTRPTTAPETAQPQVHTDPEPDIRPVSTIDALLEAAGTPTPRKTPTRTTGGTPRQPSAGTMVAKLIASAGKPLHAGRAIAFWLNTDEGRAWRAAADAKRATKGLPPAATPEATIAAQLLTAAAAEGLERTGAGWYGPIGSTAPEGVRPAGHLTDEHKRKITAARQAG